MYVYMQADTKLHNVERNMQPPGFKYEDTMHVDDIVWPIDRASSATWGRMIIDDRKASMTTYRGLLNQAIGRGGIANYVSNVIDLEIHSGAASLIAEIY